MNFLVTKSNCHAILDFESIRMEVSIYVSKSDTIEDIALIVEKDLKQFQNFANELCQNVLGKKIEELNYEGVVDRAKLRILDFLSLAIEKFKMENHLPILLKDKINPQKIICRCTGVDQEELESMVDVNYADLTQILKKSMMAQVCGSCLSDVKAACQASPHAADLLHGKSSTYWQDVIGHELGHMSQSLPNEYRELKFEFLNFKKGLLKIRCQGERSGLTRFDIQAVVRHHLQGKFQIPLEISIVF